LRDQKELADAFIQGAETAGSRRANEVARKKKKKKPSWVVILTILMILTMAGIGVGILYMLWPRPEVIVPDIVGMSLAAAQQTLREANLTYLIRDGEYNAEVEPGTVIRQSPEAGRTVRAGREVEITPSQGADLKEVPNVVGKTLLEARIALNEEGFVVGQQDTEHSDTIPAGVVISQNPRPPLRAERGTPVDVLVSLGSPVVYVNPPTLVGLTQAEAELQLRNVGLEVGAITWEYGSLGFGYVVRQGISPFERVPRGTLVSLVVSRGKLFKETVVVPASELAENSRVEISAEDREGRKIVFDQIRSPSGGDIVVEVEAVAPYYLLVTINGRVYRYERIGSE
jgi:serine/threonine-protein kinase